jgi:hypothetical protein
MKQIYKEIPPMCSSGAFSEALYRFWISWSKRSCLDHLKRLRKTVTSNLLVIRLAYHFGATHAVADTINNQFCRPSSEQRIQFVSQHDEHNQLTKGNLLNLKENPCKIRCRCDSYFYATRKITPFTAYTAEQIYGS